MALPGKRKLKIWEAGGLQRTAVIQDGSDPDPDATAGLRFDNAFLDGIRLGGTPIASDQVHAWVSSMSHRMDEGSRATVKVTGRDVWFGSPTGPFRHRLNDRVEFYAAAPATHSTTATSLPSWHLNEQTTGDQVRWFYGWIWDMSTSPDGVVTLELVDGMVKGNDVKVVMDGPGGISIPKVSFNLGPEDADFFTAVKKVDGTQPTIVTIYGTALPEDHTDYLMSVKEILEYLEAAYGAQLATAGVTASSSVFESGDLTSLTQIPGPIHLEEVGFVQAVRQVLRQWAPDMEMRYDPRTLKFRLYRKLASFTDKSSDIALASFQAGYGFENELRLQVDDPSIFSSTPGVEGNLVAVYHPTSPELSIIGAQVTRILGFVIFVSGAPYPWLPPIGATVYVLDAEVLPTVLVDIDGQLPGEELEVREDTQGVYSAVEITSIYQETTTKKLRWGGNGTIVDGVSMSWRGNNQTTPSVFEAGWKPTHFHRHVDMGSDGNGLAVYDQDTGGTGGNVRLFIAYEESGFGDDHEDAEWVGTSLYVLTANGSNVRTADYAFEIVGQVELADIGDGRPGMRIEIAEDDLDAAVGGTFLVETESTPADKVQLTDDWRFSTTQNDNIRSQVGAYITITDQEVLRQTSSPHGAICRAPHIRVHDGSGFAPRVISYPPQGPYPGSNPNPAAQWTQIAGGGLGSFKVFRRSHRVQSPIVGTCATGYTPPKLVEVEIEHTKTDVRSARFPPSGFAGWPKAVYGLERVKCITARHWVNDDQNAHYESLAERLFRVYSEPHFTGRVTKKGVQEFGALYDLAIRMAFSTNQIPVGAGSFVEQFWGVASSCVVNWEEDTVSFQFDTATPRADLAIAAFENPRRTRNELTVLQAEMQYLRQQVACLAGAQPSAAPAGACSNFIRHGAGGRPLGAVIDGKCKTDIGIGVADVSVDGGGGGAGGGSLGGQADRTIFRDLRGGYFEQGEAGLIAGTVASPFSRSLSADPRPYGTPAQNEELLLGLFKGFFGLDVQINDPPIRSSIVSTSSAGGTTTITVKHTGLTVDDYIDGEIHVLDFDPDNPRPGYTITDNTASTIDIDDPSEDTPPDGAVVVIWKKPVPVPNPTDFPNGGVVAKDYNGDWLVIDYSEGEMRAGTLDATDNEIDATANDPADTRTIRLGPNEGTGAIFDFIGEFQNRAMGLLEDTWWHWVPVRTGGLNDSGGGSLSSFNSGVDNASDYDGHSAISTWSDGNKEGVAFDFPLVGVDIDEDIEATAYFRVGTSTTGDLEMEIEGRAIGDGDNTRTGGHLFSAAAIVDMGTYSGGELVVLDMGAVLAGGNAVELDHVKGVIFRDATGGNSDDTYAGNINFIGVLFRGTRKNKYAAA